MKKSIYFILVLGFIYSCRHRDRPNRHLDSATKQIAFKKNNSNSVVYSNPLLNEYRIFLNSLNSTDAETSTFAAKKLNSLFKGQSNPICDTAFMLFSNYYDKLNNDLDDSQRKDTTLNLEKYFIRDDKSKTQKLSEKTKLYIDRLAENGFNVYLSEGDAYIGQDRDFIAKWFYGLVSPTMKKYLIQLNKENKKIYIEDASIMISPTELVDRTVWWENFVKENPNFILSKTSDENASDYLKNLLEGTDNSQVINDDTNKLNPFFAEAYDYAENKYPSSETAGKISLYHQLLLKGEIKGADSLLKIYFKEE